ncbi:DUF485 domain-containing protein [Crateriforma conspicua]|uniref:Inner membrane protein YjcH n=1 Tax=Crateriforma conspicua TaxID=2527996 RepID=A0A5C5Y4P7_9PLAN|nr:DUF485 domain-containing protein [Crateriforma conspicua]QDV65311.1 hypothetical protein Mal65_44810 [Crateriforma conspicua]TWT70706.1 hypothetical protein Pan14r_30130 [Crateriforma conspicua]
MTQTSVDAQRFNAKLGLVLFALYLLCYLGFVLTGAFAPDAFDRVLFWGLNLAIVYGFGLIVVAVLLAGIYGWFCRVEPDDEAAEAMEDRS